MWSNLVFMAEKQKAQPGIGCAFRCVVCGLVSEDVWLTPVRTID